MEASDATNSFVRNHAGVSDQVPPEGSTGSQHHPCSTAGTASRSLHRTQLPPVLHCSGRRNNGAAPAPPPSGAPTMPLSHDRSTVPLPSRAPASTRSAGNRSARLWFLNGLLSFRIITTRPNIIRLL